MNESKHCNEKSRFTRNAACERVVERVERRQLCERCQFGRQSANKAIHSQIQEDQRRQHAQLAWNLLFEHVCTLCVCACEVHEKHNVWCEREINRRTNISTNQVQQRQVAQPSQNGQRASQPVAKQRQHLQLRQAIQRGWDRAFQQVACETSTCMRACVGKNYKQNENLQYMCFKEVKLPMSVPIEPTSELLLRANCVILPGA